MKTVYFVILYAGFIVSAFIFFSSLFVTTLSRYRLDKGLAANRAWLTPNWLAILFLGFGTPFFFLGVLIWNRGEGNLVLVTAAAALILGFFLGKKVEEELRDHGRPKGGGTRKKKSRR